MHAILARLMALAALLLPCSAALADWANGRSLYLNGPVGLGLACQDCHGNPPAFFGIGLAANNPTLIGVQIQTYLPMKPFAGRLSSADLVDIAAYIASPSADPNAPPAPGCAATASCNTVSAYTGLWWNANESGWGMSVTQHGSINFVAMYTYDQSGQAIWYVIPNCPLLGNSCSGALYKVVGGTPPSAPWNGSGKIVTQVGSGTLNFASTDSASFVFSIDGVAGAKSIVRQLFAAGSAPAVDYSDLWWNANESGWGVALTQQANTIFATWYAYDAAGRAVWYVASNCALVGSACSGTLYRVVGGSPLTAAWNGASLVVTPVGTLNITFSDAGSGTMSYLINGVGGSRSITRQGF